MGLSTNLLISLTIDLLLVSSAHGAARFTVVPPSVLYVSVGETARFVWDYTVNNRTEEFDIASPRWIFYPDSGSASLIGRELVFDKWKWSINKNTCPARLLNPVRVSKESTATLVIHNVTLADSGTYGCSLVLTARSPITSKAKLIVTSLTKLNLSATFMQLKEYSGLIVNCSAVGTPTPNITWVKLQGSVTLIKHEGVGNVHLKIRNITRHESGIYQCCATNNPNDAQVCRRTRVTVMYKPDIDIISSSTSVISFTGKIIRLYCEAIGVPSPLFTWYDPRDHNLTTGIHYTKNSSVLEVKIENADHYGSYTCRAANQLGYDEHVINVTETALTTPKALEIKPTIETESASSVCKGTREIKVSNTNGTGTKKQVFLLPAVSGVVIFVLVGIIVILTAMTLKNYHKNKDWKEDERNHELPVDIPVYAQVDNSDNNIRHDVLVLEPIPTVSETSPGIAGLKPQVIQPVPQESGLQTFLKDETKQKDNAAGQQQFLSENKHVYQKLSNDLLLPREQEYQLLERNNDTVVTQANPSSVATERCLNRSNNTEQKQGYEYQSLHLYANIDEK